MLKKIAALLIVMIFIVSLCAGCSTMGYVENQAYAVMLGIDLLSSGDIELTVRYPKLAGSSNGGSAPEGGSYLNTSAVGSDLQESLKELRIQMPRTLNLAALTMVVISEDVAASGNFAEILHELAINYRMYSGAYVSLCNGSAKSFLEKQEPELGTRLSEDIKARIENSADIGSIPDSRLADLYFGLNSPYSNTPIMLCSYDENFSAAYIGSAVINDNGYILKLNSEETILSGLLRGDIKRLTFCNSETSAHVVADSAPDIIIKNGNTTEIDISLKLSAMIVSGTADIKRIGDMLETELRRTIDKCRYAYADPFGFSETAASNFFDLNDLLSYNWSKHFYDADIDIDIDITEVFRRE